MIELLTKDYVKGEGQFFQQIVWKYCQNGMKKRVALISFLVLVVLLLASCAGQKASDSIVGKWKSDQSQQVIEFTADGIYKGIQQEHYTYEVLDGKQLRIVNPEYADGSDSILMDFVLENDNLSTTVGETTITWKRQK